MISVVFGPIFSVPRPQTPIRRGVAQLVARQLWELDVASSSLATPTRKKGLALQVLFSMKSPLSGLMKNEDAIADEVAPAELMENGGDFASSGGADADFINERERVSSSGRKPDFI